MLVCCRSAVDHKARRLIVGLDLEPSIGSRVSTSVGSSRQNHGTIVSIDGDRVKGDGNSCCGDLVNSGALQSAGTGET